ncbi:MAG TPA: monofunctional biosynthetic peptidoglycan transglycosylase [Bacteroidia bacterium]|nr:monofunctional biosynthetic peptidoglycan transglycosylase [Bacteroidia bacterium]
MFIGVMIVLRFIWTWVKRIIFFGIIASILSVLLFKYVMVPFTPLMISRSIEHIFDGKTPKLKKTWVALDDMSKEMPLAAMCAEDGNFLNHHGFDFEAMEKAWKYNNKHGDKKPIKGGSTISQQVAKNVFLWQGRTYLRKGLEVYFTFLIELIWSKHRIMEVYLNVIEMGDGIYGAEEASQAYYNKSCKKLKRGEAALIAVCFPNPRKLSPLTPNKRLFNKQQKIVRLMNYTGKIDWNKPN